MTIRPAQPFDEERLLELTREFLKLSPYEALFPPAEGHLEALYAKVVEFGQIYCAVNEDDRIVGMIAGVIVPHAMTGHMYCEEVIWYVEKGARTSGCGLQLLGALTDWASTNGATMLKMLAPAESAVGRLLEREGFGRVETAFMKLLARPTVAGAVRIEG